MTTRDDLVTRESVLALLSDAETAKVATAESLLRIAKGDEFIDLAQLELGVQRSKGDAPTAKILPRKAVTMATWKKILAKIPANRK